MHSKLNLWDISLDKRKKVFIETYGCQMNVSDSEVVVSILQNKGYVVTDSMDNADLILVNTCAIRDNAETRVKGRLDVFRQVKKRNKKVVVGVIGCMAERLKEDLLENHKAVDLVVGPDAYRDLPHLLDQAMGGKQAINTLLSVEETYADVSPVRLDNNHVSAFVAIMRGCNNFCSYCVVPYTRGRERSRKPETVLHEVSELQQIGYKEVTFLGQNVNSYQCEGLSFPKLMEKAAQQFPQLRFRFATSHPKDLSDELIEIIAANSNICRHIHLPVQSGSSTVLERMNRKYTREWYLNRVEAIKQRIPNCALTTDIIAGFCDETEEEHQDTISIMKKVGYDFAYMFKYSERPGTYAQKHFTDNITEQVKTQRLNEIISLQNSLSAESNQADIGKTLEVLVEGVSKKSDNDLFGRTSQNKAVVFPKGKLSKGDYARIKITRATSATLFGHQV